MNTNKLQTAHLNYAACRVIFRLLAGQTKEMERKTILDVANNFNVEAHVLADDWEVYYNQEHYLFLEAN